MKGGDRVVVLDVFVMKQPQNEEWVGEVLLAGCCSMDDDECLCVSHSHNHHRARTSPSSFPFHDLRTRCLDGMGES